MSALIEGEAYEGEWVVVQSGGGFVSSFGSASAYGSAGSAVASGSSFAALSSADGDGQAVMVGDKGSQIRCKFHYNQISSSGQGICQRSDDALFDMMIK